MNEEDAKKLCEVTKEGSRWEQYIFVDDDSGDQINISSAVHGGKNVAKTPDGATKQPTFYPRNCAYRFPTRFKGIESWSSLKDLLLDKETCPGANMVSHRSDLHCTDSAATIARFTLCCHKHKVQTKMDEDKLFEPGKMARNGIKAESILTTKTKGSKTPGVLAMYSKTIKDSLPAREQAALINKTAKVPRMLSKRAPSNHTKCDMKLIIILNANDQYFYLTTKSVVYHNNHTFVSPSATARTAKEFNQNEMSFLDLMYEERVNTTQMARIMTSLKGKENGVFLPSTIYDMNKKSKQMLQVAHGISPNMSDAEVTLKQLVV